MYEAGFSTPQHPRASFFGYDCRQREGLRDPNGAVGVELGTPKRRLSSTSYEEVAVPAPQPKVA